MGYTMEIFVDGACRRNGSPDATAAAAAVWKERSGRHRYFQRQVNGYCYTATNQRAEITAVILGLATALKRYRELDSCPRLDVKIHSDSQYVVDAMRSFVFKWIRNGWINTRGEEVANRDLFEEALELKKDLVELGDVHFIKIPRQQNEEADGHCNEMLDAMEQGRYDSDDDD